MRRRVARHGPLVPPRTGPFSPCPRRVPNRATIAPVAPHGNPTRRPDPRPRRAAPGRPRGRFALALAPALVLAIARVALAHGGAVPDEAPSPEGLLLEWSFDPLLWIPLLASAAAYLWAVRRVSSAHPGNPVPRDRPVFFLLGLAAIAVALQSGIERWDTTLFSIHMVQHVILIFVAAPALVLGAPVTLALRVASPRVRGRWLLPALHSRAVRLVGHPLIAALLFTAVMWGTHFSPIFDAALVNAWIHDLEHLLYLASAILFFLPVVGRDPGPHRMEHPARLLYLLVQMPMNSFLGVAILFSSTVLYPHYATTGRTWGPTPLEDQQLAGALMWGLGDLGFLVALLLVIASWMRAEEARTRRRESLDDSRAAAAALVTASAAAGQAPDGIGAAR